ncbi:MAG: recombinase RecT [Chitinophagaceae bacterium]|nr:recombinase RecT [Chitinophagaceae bacterium]
MSTKVEQKVSIIQKLDTTSPTQIVNLPEVADRFKKLYVTFNGKSGEKYYEAEKFHFAKLLQENAKLAECSKLSLYGCFLDVAVNGLSFDPTMKHVYLVPYNVKKGDNNWEKRAQLQISGQGELLLRMQQGQIKYADNPVLVYEGDIFKTGTRNGQLFVDHEATIPLKTIISLHAIYE